MLAITLTSRRRKNMENGKMFRRLSIMTLLIVLVVSSCSGGNVAALNGTWEATDTGIWGGMEGTTVPPYVLYNGNWERENMRGTYSVSGSTVTFTVTQWGVMNFSTGEREWEPEDGVDPFSVEIRNNSFVRSGVTYTKQ
jgi:hypothetical protein